MVPLQLLSLCPIYRWTGLLALYSHIGNVNKKPINVLEYPLERGLLFIDKYFGIDKCQARQLYCSCAPRTRWLCKEVAIYCYVVVIMVLLSSLFSGEVYSSKRN